MLPSQYLDAYQRVIGFGNITLLRYMVGVHYMIGSIVNTCLHRLVFEMSLYRQYLSAQIGFGNIALLHYVVGSIVNTHLHVYSHDGNGWSVESQCSHTCSYDGNGWSVESQCSHLVS